MTAPPFHIFNLDKILKQNMFHIMYNYKVNLQFTDDELGQIIALHSYNTVTLLEKRLNAEHQSTLNCHYQTCQILTVPCNCNIKYALYLFTPTNTCIYSQRQTSLILYINNNSGGENQTSTAVQAT
jgi:hypothetical protein